MSHRTNPHKKPRSPSEAKPQAASEKSSKAAKPSAPSEKASKASKSPGAGNRPSSAPRASPSPRQTPQAGRGGREADAGNASDTLQGEGNVTAARHYNEDQRDFVSEGRVDDAARAAAPRNADEERAMADAEREGRSHAKEEDPSIPRDYRR